MATSTNPNQPRMETMSVSQARQQFSETLNRVYRDDSRIVVEKSGIPVAAIVSLRDLEDLQYLAHVKTQGWDSVRRLRDAFADVPDDELEREIDDAISNVKRERRQASWERASAPVPR